MNYSKGLLILYCFICFFFAYCATPTFLNAKGIEYNRQHFITTPITMGLDLKGGISIITELDIKSYIKATLESKSPDIESFLHKSNIRYSGIDIRDNILQIAGAKLNNKELEELISALEKTTCSQCVAVTKEENNINVALTEKHDQIITTSLIERVIEIIKKRVDESGTKEIEVIKFQENKILLNIPGIYDIQSIKRLLGTTAKLELKEIVLPDKQKAYSTSMEALPLLHTNPEQKSQKLYVYKRSIIDGSMIVDARALNHIGEYVVSFSLNAEGAKKFGTYTSKNVGKYLGIIIDNKIISAPSIREPIRGGSGIISGSFSLESASELASMLRSGSLPVALTIVEEKVIGPTLGESSVHSGSIATVIALLCIITFMLIFYRIWGVFTNISLLLNLIIIIGIVSLMNATLTLPGIAGIVLTLGMAVDANILIFEKIKEELRHIRIEEGNISKKHIIATMKKSYSQVMRTILDANITTIIAALALYIFGMSALRGFAVTIIVGILSSVFTAVGTTYFCAAIWCSNFKAKKLEM
ncbi:protein translocase subunit SecD [Candidatus Fokinia crypta]|uniref:Protein translocase subunit SecD n=1 Tax=Candidatus Fokinia crypta TaxID=1920990 RepID=A0ABZ0UPR1_9RICK|nr:protein translocase subunit SecD [Candidatus Fokinia cryptica]WPX97684.1 Protein translocase subunit SecD [Candidatus Fokinia cryptica]